MAWDEFPLVVVPHDDEPLVDWGQTTGDFALGALTGNPQVAVWTVPPLVRSFSVSIVGGGGAPAWTAPGLFPFPLPNLMPATFYNVPCTPGDEWLFEGGDGIIDVGLGGASGRDSLRGGDGIYYPPDYVGESAGAASIIRRRRGGTVEVFAVAGGYGGAWRELTGAGSYTVATEGPTVYGGFTPEPGAGSAGANALTGEGGAGGGGWPGGAAGAPSSPGISGTNYMPDVPGSTLDGPSSPGSSVWSHPSYAPVSIRGLGVVRIWYYRQPLGGWRVGNAW